MCSHSQVIIATPNGNILHCISIIVSKWRLICESSNFFEDSIRMIFLLLKNLRMKEVIILEGRSLLKSRIKLNSCSLFLFLMMLMKVMHLFSLHGGDRGFD